MPPRENQRVIYPRERIANLGMHYWKYGTPVSCLMFNDKSQTSFTIEAITGAVWDRIRQLSESVEKSHGPAKEILQQEKTLLAPIAAHFLSKSAVSEQYANEMLQKLQKGVRQAREQDEVTARIAALSGEETVDQFAQACTLPPFRTEEINFIAKMRMTMILIKRTLREPTFLGDALTQSALLPFMKDYLFDAVGRETPQRQFAAIMHTAAERIPWENLEPSIAVSLRSRLAQVDIHEQLDITMTTTTPKPPAAARVPQPHEYRAPLDVRLT